MTDARPRDTAPLLPQWQTAALLKDRTRRAIRDRHQAGESDQSLADDYGVPVDFVTALCAWQLFGDVAQGEAARDPGTQPQELYESHIPSRSETLAARPLAELGVLAPERASMVPPTPEYTVSSDGESGTTQTWRGADAQTAQGRKLEMVVAGDPGLRVSLAQLDEEDLRAARDACSEQARRCDEAAMKWPNEGHQGGAEQWRVTARRLDAALLARVTPGPLGMQEQLYHQLTCASLLQRGPCDCQPVTVAPRVSTPPEE